MHKIGSNCRKPLGSLFQKLVVCGDSLEPNHYIGKDFYSHAERAAHVLLLLKYLKKFMERYRSAPENRMASPGWTMGILCKFILPHCSTNKTADRELHFAIA